MYTIWMVYGCRSLRLSFLLFFSVLLLSYHLTTSSVFFCTLADQILFTYLLSFNLHKCLNQPNCLPSICSWTVFVPNSSLMSLILPILVIPLILLISSPRFVSYYLCLSPTFHFHVLMPVEQSFTYFLFGVPGHLLFFRRFSCCGIAW